MIVAVGHVRGRNAYSNDEWLPTDQTPDRMLIRGQWRAVSHQAIHPRESRSSGLGSAGVSRLHFDSPTSSVNYASLSTLVEVMDR